MSQLVYPQSIDAHTDIVASELQGNFIASRDLINGNLEGAALGGFSNLKASSVGATDLADLELKWLSGNDYSVYQEGVRTASEGRITPGAGLILNYASLTGALIRDDTGALAAGALFPANTSSSTVTIGANASGNPRIDQVVATLTGFGTATVSVVPGTASGGATLDNRTGAAALPASAIRLADILMPNAFAGPFIQGTHIRDRRPWATGAFVFIQRTQNAAAGSDYTTASAGSVAIDATNLLARVEIASGSYVEAALYGRLRNATGAAVMNVLTGPDASSGLVDGGAQHVQYTVSDTASGLLSFSAGFATAGSRLWTPAWSTSAGTATLLAQATIPVYLVIKEYPNTNGGASNSGA